MFSTDRYSPKGILSVMHKGGRIAIIITAAVAALPVTVAASAPPNSEPAEATIDEIYEGPNLTVVIDTDADDIREFVLEQGADEVSADVIASGASLNVYTDTHVYFVTVDDGTYVVAIANA